MAADGKLVVVWESRFQHDSLLGVHGQLFDVDGTELGDEFQLNTFTQEDQAYADVAMDENGDFVTVWHSWLQDGSAYGVYGQRWALALFTDGFESGDTSSWSRTVE